jgi:hypothetical protein
MRAPSGPMPVPAFALAFLVVTSCASVPASAPAPAHTPAPGAASEAAPAPMVGPGSATDDATNDPRAPAHPGAPPLDPAADRQARLSRLHDELGDGLPVATEDPFLLAGPGWTRPSLGSVVKLVHDALGALYSGRFTTRPARVVGVYLFPSNTLYERFCKDKLGEPCMSPYGFYRPDARIIVMNAGLGIGTLTHEIIHPLVEADFPGAPTWIDEGIASLFEAPVIPRPGEIHGVKNWRLPRLRHALGSPKERDTTRLDALFGMTDEAFRDGDEPLHYAMARYACQWLDDGGKLWAFYHAWRDSKGDDPSGARAFASVMGETPVEANDAWLSWVRSL